jgi:signal transduction histidine kinase/CheY-like chemotaxis protein
VDPELINHRLERERAARRQAETLLESKSRELFDARLAAEQRAEALAEANAQLLEEIEEHERTQAALAIARDEALEAIRLKSRFLANISHEIRTPMNAVLGILDDSRSWGLAPDHAEALNVAHHSAGNLLRLLNDLLDLSKLEANQMDLYPRPTHVAEVVREVCRLFAPKSGKRGVAMKCDVRGFEDSVSIDSGRMRQILTNLASNAVRLTQEGVVVIRAHRLPGGFGRFEVVDTGPGIREEDRHRIFNSFVQAEGQAASGNGTGLGLSIARALVDAMGGTMGLDSQVGVGSTFWFEIPCPQAPSMPAPLPTELPTATGWRVLVVDDNAVNRMVIIRHLVALGCGVQEADSGPKALALASQSEFDVVLMDLLMPGMDGLEATRQLKEMHPSLPVLACSASVLESDRVEAKVAGMAGFVPKPVRRPELYAAISSALLHPCPGDVHRKPAFA